jgi:integrase
VQFPRIAVRRPDGLDRQSISLILQHADYRFGLYIRTLGGGGLREDEAAQLTPKHFDFPYNEDPAKVHVTKEIAKFSIEHETFLPNKLGLEIQNYVNTNKIQSEQKIFVNEYTKHTVSCLGHSFERLRKKTGLQTMQREKFARNQIRLHSFRAWFITTWTDLGFESFGHALAGHTAHLSVYYRKSPEQRLALYKEHQALFAF